MRKNERRAAVQTQLVLTALGAGMGYDHEQVVKYLVSSVVDGVRRPGSWERSVVESLFGPEAVRAAAFELRRDESEEK